MAFKVLLVPAARNDIAAAIDYIALDSREAALRWYEGLRDAIFSLSEFPTRCSMIPESEILGIQLRQLHYQSHRIIFRLREDKEVVEVLRVYHGARKGLRQKDF